ncbi:hypothetical protein AN958_08879 [Leucoagaricus sp. SymC.cos]|nr:hypothetical protein AN958_08879 [Leucoagaricus sp. SymC.cos]
MPREIHLLILIHGMWGAPGNLVTLEKTIKDKYDESNERGGEELELLCVKAIGNGVTYDGIDWGGERVAAEVLERVEDLEKDSDKVVKLSITGYSLGGLIARYMLGILEHRHFFDNVEPINFVTIATPHLGLLNYPSMVSSLMSTFVPKLLSRTGEQFYCLDTWSNTGRPLIEVMADPNEVFYKTLSRFKYLRLYANAINDATVPYCTSAIETQDVFVEYTSNGIKVEMEEDYDHVVSNFTIPDAPPPKPAILSREWLVSMRPKPLLPPFRFPFNIMLHGILPIVIIPAITFFICRFIYETRASRNRIQQSESEESYRQRLSSVFHELENKVESTVIEVVEEGGSYSIINPKLHPAITPLQKKIAGWLNQLPFEKKLAYFPDVRNSHPVIICRDLHRFQSREFIVNFAHNLDTHLI